MNPISRILAIAQKELRLNTRFPIQFFVNNLMTPIKTAALMYLIYRGFLSGTDFNVGILNNSNYQAFVFLGTTCHALFINCQGAFRGSFVSEKYWQTLTATFSSPANIFEIVGGYVIGNAFINFFIATIIIAITCIMRKSSATNFALSLIPLAFLSFIAFGVGVVGATISLVAEGKSFLYDYFIQGLVFLSCFYYPIDTLPQSLRPVVIWLPTYQASQMIQQIILNGYYPEFMMGALKIGCVSALSLIISAVIMDKSVRKYGLVGY